jgi:hypothetical protein
MSRTWCHLTGLPLQGPCPCRLPCADSDADAEAIEKEKPHA